MTIRQHSSDLRFLVVRAIHGLTLVALTTIIAAAAPPEKAKKPKFTAAPGVDLSKPIIWGSECETPDGQGLRFGGCDQKADDGAVHTQVKVDGQWRPILGELRRANPLQEYYNRVRDAAPGSSGNWPVTAASISRACPPMSKECLSPSGPSESMPLTM